MEKRMIAAIAVSMLIMMAWPTLFGPKKDETRGQKTVSKPSKEHVGETVATKSTGLLPSESFEEKTYTFESEHIRLKLSSVGAKIKQLWFKKYIDQEEKHIRFFSDSVTGAGGVFFPELESLEFLPVRTDKEQTLLLENSLSGIRIEYSFDEQNPYLLHVKTHTAGSDRLSISFRDIAPESSSGYSFSDEPSARDKEFIIYTMDKAERISIRRDRAEAVRFESRTDWIALSDRYFIIAAVSDVESWFGDIVANRPEDRFHVTNFTALPTQQVNHYRLFVGPKDLNYLRPINSSLGEAIDHGWFAVLSVPMLQIMKFFYSIIPNYGVAILLLTLLVRLIMFPLQHKSMKSMKKMQELQPHLKNIQQKYKNDKERLNKEMMQFMKTHKVNPMGGCFPMLLQLPVFIALYRVLGNAVELYMSPFMLWITDLSSRDPYYVLPFLMGAMMFLQQKMMPNPTMDPAQAKMMLFFLPIIFTIFMLQLPSGLTLYIMFSTLLGITQQYMMNKKKKSSN